MVAASAQYGSTGAEIDLEAFLEFSAGVSAQMICSLISAGASEWLAIGGEAGAISLPHPAFTAGPGDLSPICVHPTGAPELEVLPGLPADPCQVMIEAFSEAILRGEPAPYPLSESRTTLRILEAFSISARAGTSIQSRNLSVSGQETAPAHHRSARSLPRCCSSGPRRVPQRAGRAPACR